MTDSTSDPAAGRPMSSATDQAFDYQNTGTRVLMRPGAIDGMGADVDRLGCRRLLLICGGNTRRGAVFERVRQALGARVVSVFDRVVEHSSTAMVSEGARVVRQAAVDGLVAVGGGSASDTAKAIAILAAEGGRLEDHATRFVPPDKFFPTDLRAPKLPVIAVPTTASAAEVTPGLGIRDEAGRKLLFWDTKLACRLIVLDPLANLDVPAAVMAATGMNAFAHCVEGLYSRLRNPMSDALALHAIRLLTPALPSMVANPGDVGARAAVLSGAHLSGMVICNARVGIHHAVCHCLGALGGLSHGVANSILLPHAVAYNLDVAAAEIAQVAAAMGVETRGLPERAAAEAAVDAIRALQLAARVPRRLSEAGLARERLPAIAEHALGDRGLYFNPKPTASAAPILELLERAW